MPGTTAPAASVTPVAPVAPARGGGVGVPSGRPGPPGRPGRPGRGRSVRPGWIAWRIGRVLVLAWGLFAMIGCAFQDRLIFPAPRVAADRPPPDDAVVAWVEVAPDVRVEGWFLPGRGRSVASPGPAVMVFHGNAELIDHAGFDIDLYRTMGVSVLACEYRGYGRSGGRPSRAAIVADAVAFRDWLDARPEVDPALVMYHGRSIGGAVAVDLAASRPPAAMVLTSTFTSMRAMFTRALVPGFLCRHRFETQAALRSAAVPVLIVHGSEDRVVPVAHGRRLGDSTPGATYVELPGEGHVLPLDRPAYRDPVRAFVADALGLTASGPPGRAAESGGAAATP